MAKFLNTAFGSYLKVLLATILSIIVLKITQDKLTISQIVSDVKILDQIITVALISWLPVVINALNPKDTRYGKNNNP